MPQALVEYAQSAINSGVVSLPAADTTTSSPIPAKAGESAPPATLGAWWRRRRTARTTASPDKAALHIGAVAFIHRFGSSLNGHVHVHVCVFDGAFEAVAGEGDADADVQASPPGVVFHPASAINAPAVAQVQATLRKRILRAFVARGLLESLMVLASRN